LPELTILIPTLQNRKDFFGRLTDVLTPQCKQYNVLINVLEDNGEAKIGTKRNQLLDSCQTEYCVFIDDDDLVSSNYLEKIMEGIKKGVDVITFKGIITSEGKQPETFIHKLGLKYEQQKGIYRRPPNHLNPMKTEIAKQVRFPEISFGEDTDFCKRLADMGLLKTEHYIDLPLYFYQYRRSK